MYQNNNQQYNQQADPAISTCIIPMININDAISRNALPVPQLGNVPQFLQPHIPTLVATLINIVQNKVNNNRPIYFLAYNKLTANNYNNSIWSEVVNFTISSCNYFAHNPDNNTPRSNNPIDLINYVSNLTISNYIGKLCGLHPEISIVDPNQLRVILNDANNLINSVQRYGQGNQQSMGMQNNQQFLQPQQQPPYDPFQNTRGVQLPQSMSGFSSGGQNVDTGIPSTGATFTPQPLTNSIVNKGYDFGGTKLTNKPVNERPVQQMPGQIKQPTVVSSTESSSSYTDTSKYIKKSGYNLFNPQKASYVSTETLSNSTVVQTFKERDLIMDINNHFKPVNNSLDNFSMQRDDKVVEEKWGNIYEDMTNNIESVANVSITDITNNIKVNGSLAELKHSVNVGLALLKDTGKPNVYMEYDFISNGLISDVDTRAFVKRASELKTIEEIHILLSHTKKEVEENKSDRLLDRRSINLFNKRMTDAFNSFMKNNIGTESCTIDDFLSDTFVKVTLNSNGGSVVANNIYDCIAVLLGDKILNVFKDNEVNLIKSVFNQIDDLLYLGLCSNYLELDADDELPAGVYPNYIIDNYITVGVSLTFEELDIKFTTDTVANIINNDLPYFYKLVNNLINSNKFGKTTRYLVKTSDDVLIEVFKSVVSNECLLATLVK